MSQWVRRPRARADSLDPASSTLTHLRPNAAVLSRTPVVSPDSSQSPSPVPNEGGHAPLSWFNETAPLSGPRFSAGLISATPLPRTHSYDGADLNFNHPVSSAIFPSRLSLGSPRSSSVTGQDRVAGSATTLEEFFPLSLASSSPLADSGIPERSRVPPADHRPEGARARHWHDSGAISSNLRGLSRIDPSVPMEPTLSLQRAATTVSTSEVTQQQGLGRITRGDAARTSLHERIEPSARNDAPGRQSHGSQQIQRGGVLHSNDGRFPSSVSHSHDAQQLSFSTVIRCFSADSQSQWANEARNPLVSAPAPNHFSVSSHPRESHMREVQEPSEQASRTVSSVAHPDSARPRWAHGFANQPIIGSVTHLARPTARLADIHRASERSGRLFYRDNASSTTFGVPQALLEALPEEEYRVISESANIHKACSICLNDFQPDEVLRRLPCLHKFHASCIDRWLQEKVSCPTCRESVLEGLGHCDLDPAQRRLLENHTADLERVAAAEAQTREIARRALEMEIRGSLAIPSMGSRDLEPPMLLSAIDPQERLAGSPLAILEHSRPRGPRCTESEGSHLEAGSRHVPPPPQTYRRIPVRSPLGVPSRSSAGPMARQRQRRRSFQISLDNGVVPVSPLADVSVTGGENAQRGTSSMERLDNEAEGSAGGGRVYRALRWCAMAMRGQSGTEGDGTGRIPRVSALDGGEPISTSSESCTETVTTPGRACPRVPGRESPGHSPRDIRVDENEVLPWSSASLIPAASEGSGTRIGAGATRVPVESMQQSLLTASRCPAPETVDEYHDEPSSWGTMSECDVPPVATPTSCTVPPPLAAETPLSGLGESPDPCPAPNGASSGQFEPSPSQNEGPTTAQGDISYESPIPSPTNRPAWVISRDFLRGRLLHPAPLSSQSTAADSEATERACRDPAGTTLETALEARRSLENFPAQPEPQPPQFSDHHIELFRDLLTRVR